MSARHVGLKNEGREMKVSIRDDLTRIVKAAYAIDGGEWVPIFPEDGLFDEPGEAMSFSPLGGLAGERMDL